MPPQAVSEQPGADRLLLFDAHDLRILMASPAATAFLGYPPDGLIGLGLLDLLEDVAPLAWARLVRRIASRGASNARFRARLRRADGETAFAEILFHVVTDPVRPIFCASLLAPGAGIRPTLDAALLRSVVDTAPDAIVTIDADGIIDSFSPAAERMFGYSADEVIGRNVALLMPEPYAREHDDYIARYRRTGERRIIGIGRTVTALHRSGRTFPIELAVGEVQNGGNRVFTGFIRDISERVAAQARASTLQQELSHVGRLSAMGEIASMIVHEINQPLTAIANFGEAARRLVEAGDTSGRAAAYMERSVAQAHRASDIIRRLRAFVARGTSDREPIAVNEVVRDAARIALIGAADRQIRARFDLAEGLPEVAADRVQVQQVVVNLIRNGIDAMLDADTPAPTLVVATGCDGKGVLISVTDNGPGIAEGTDVFAPFVTTKPGGMGIGLSVSRSIVEAHGGTIWTEPAAGGGTRFAFALPTSAGAAP